MDLLYIIPAFLVTIAILVTVHEFGHYWVARKLGVKVLRFSIGFGKVLWSKKAGADGTEYAVSALPLGGYVAMLGENGEDVPEEEKHRAFRAQPVWKRFAIVFAGPAFNFILAAILYMLMYTIGVPAMKPYVYAQANTPAALAGIEAGDQIKAINDIPVASFQEVRMLMLEEYLKTRELSLQVETAQGMSKTRILDLSQQSLLKEESDYFYELGFRAWSPVVNILISAVMPDSGAEAAGLKAMDKVLSINGQTIARAEDFVSAVKASEGESLLFTIERDGQRQTLPVVARKVEVEGQTIWRIGVGVGESVPPEVLTKLQFTQRLGPWDALQKGIDGTRQMTVMSFKLIGKLFTGEVSLRNVSGPITIAKYAGDAVQSGLISFLGFLAIISVSLGLLNLLPIPMLDGGYLLYYVVEMLKGSPVSQRVEEIGMRIGLVMIASLMVLAFHNDLMRVIESL